MAAIHVESSAAGHGPLVHHRPQIGSEAMFSLEYAMAAALEDGRIGCASFADAQVSRAAIRESDSRLYPRENAPSRLMTDDALTGFVGSVAMRRYCVSYQGLVLPADGDDDA